MEHLIVAALYKFAPLGDLETLRGEITRACEKNNICGTLLLAHEGINGTIAVAMTKQIAITRSATRFDSMSRKHEAR